MVSLSKKKKHDYYNQRYPDGRHHKKWERSGKYNRHHDFAKSRGGTYSEQNIYIWDISAHEAFHFLFGNRTLLEASDWLRKIDSQNKEGVKLDILGDDYAGEQEQKEFNDFPLDFKDVAMILAVMSRSMRDAFVFNFQGIEMRANPNQSVQDIIGEYNVQKYGVQQEE